MSNVCLLRVGYGTKQVVTDKVSYVESSNLKKYHYCAKSSERFYDPVDLLSIYFLKKMASVWLSVVLHNGVRKD